MKKHERRIKVEGGKVIGHAPLNDEIAIAEDWPIVTVFDELPKEGLNGLMSVGALHLVDGELTWDEDWQAKITELRRPKPSRLDLLEARVLALEEAGK